MNARAFIDTNIFIYLYSSAEQSRREACINTLDKYTRVTSMQVLNEISNVFIKKYHWPVEKIQQHLDNIEEICSVRPVDRKIIDAALLLNQRYGYSYYDCLMLASALENDCDILLSEDMSNRQIIEGKLQIVNPFA